MTSRPSIREKDSVESPVEQRAFVADEPQLEPTVALERQAKIDSEAREKIAWAAERDHPHGMTLAAEEKWQAREAEKARTRARSDRSQESIREALCREMTDAHRPDPTASGPDPREQLDQETIGAVNQQAYRLSDVVDDGLSTAAIARALAERLQRGQALQGAVLEMIEVLKAQPGTIIPIADIGDVPREEVAIEGEIIDLWEASHPAVQQLGLIADDSGKVKFTTWKKSRQTLVQEGDRVRFRGAKVNYYRGRYSVALTSKSHIIFPEREYPRG